jgi:anti-sigma regulatory factor (Ser/Thr protein kinase)
MNHPIRAQFTPRISPDSSLPTGIRHGQKALAEDTPSAWPLSNALPPFGALSSAPRMARAHLRDILDLWGLSPLAEQAEYVVSELVTNAVNASTHDGQPIYDDSGRMLTVGLELRTDTRLLRITVWDRADGAPVPRHAESDAVSGRGLAMVTYFSSARWGWTSRDSHGWKSVHAILGPEPVKETERWFA